MKELKPYLLSIGGMAVAVLLFYFLGEFIIPFFLGLLLAYFANNHITKVQKFIPNRSLAVTSYLALAVTIALGVLILFGAQIVNDIQRLNSAFTTFTQEHQEEIDEVSEEVRSYIEMIYTSDEVQETLNSFNLDSLSDGGRQDSSTTAILTDALSNITSFMGQGNGDGSGEEKEEEGGKSINWLVVLFSALGYFVYTLYTFPYFEQKFEKYFGPAGEISGGLGAFMLDFQRIFLDYFKRRTWIVLICSGIFIITFLVLSIPGAILLGLLAGILCYIAHFHYIALLPLALSSWVVSIEQSQSFFLYFGIILGIFILVSILEELVLYPQFMEEISGVNPAILILFTAIWTYLLGGLAGTFLTLPLTTVVLIYADRLLLYWKDQREAAQTETSE